MLNDVLNTFKNFLLITCVFLFYVMVFVKNKTFKIKKNIRDIETKIVMLDKEIEVIDLELTYLSNPNRLKNIYSKVKQIDIPTNIDDKTLIAKEQIKDIKTLIPYYYANIKDNKDPVAQK